MPRRRHVVHIQDLPVDLATRPDRMVEGDDVDALTSEALQAALDVRHHGARNVVHVRCFELDLCPHDHIGGQFA